MRDQLTSPALLALITEGGDVEALATAAQTRNAASGGATSAAAAAAAGGGGGADGDATAGALAAAGGAGMPELSEPLRFFEEAFDWSKARASGRVEPKPGADAAVVGGGKGGGGGGRALIATHASIGFKV